jgi:ABC-2 type transport system ATP-binding protein
MSAPSHSQIPIRVEGVSKTFAKTRALDAVSLEVFAGQVFGVLGPNGAGKTTLIRTILDIIRPDSGRIEIFGHAFRAEDRDRIGYLPEERGLYSRQKVGAVLEYLGALKGMPVPLARSQSKSWLERFELTDGIDQKVEQLSKGNQQKIQFISTLLANPPILILDEPLSGLDPLSARLVNTVIRERAAAGQTVLLSTHQMGMVEALCTRVFMIAHGRRVLYGDLREIKRQHSADAVRVQSTADYRACPLVARIDGEMRSDRPVDVHLRNGTRGEEFLQWLVAMGATVDSFERMSTPLEDIFVKVAESARA